MEVIGQDNISVWGNKTWRSYRILEAHGLPLLIPLLLCQLAASRQPPADPGPPSPLSARLKSANFFPRRRADQDDTPFDSTITNPLPSSIQNSKTQSPSTRLNRLTSRVLFTAPINCESASSGDLDRDWAVLDASTWSISIAPRPRSLLLPFSCSIGLGTNDHFSDIPDRASRYSK